MADQPDNRSEAWAIRGITPAARNAATAEAERQKLTIGQWVDRAIMDKLVSDRKPTPVVLPVTPLTPVAPHEMDAPPAQPSIELIDRIEKIVAQISTMAAAGCTPTKRVVRLVCFVLSEELEGMKLARVRGPGTTGRGMGTTQAKFGGTNIVDGATNANVGIVDRA